MAFNIFKKTKNQKNDLFKDFITACKTNNTEAVDKLKTNSDVLKKISKNIVTNDQNETVLHIACRDSCSDIVTVLLRMGAGQDIANIQGDFPIHLATESDKDALAKVKVLVEKCSSTVHKRGRDNETPLHKAVTVNNVEVANHLLDIGVNFTSQNKQSALHISVALGHVEMIPILLKKGANIMAKDDSGNNAIWIAIAKNQIEALDILVSNSNWAINRHNEVGDTPLHWAVKRDNLAAVKCLTYHICCDLNQKNNKRQTPLDVAQQNGHTQICEYLAHDHKLEELTDFRHACFEDDIRKVRELASSKPIKERINETQDTFQNTVLHVAADKASEKIVEIVLNLGARTDIQDKNKNLPMHYAASSQFRALHKVRMLAEKGPDSIHARGYKGETPLYRASRVGNADVVELLLSRGVNVATDHKQTPLLVAVDFSYDSSKHSASRNTEYQRVVQILLDKGADVTATDESGKTALMLAATHGNVQIVDVLLESIDNPDHINLQTRDGHTALHWAVYNKHCEVVRLLVSKPMSMCNPNIRNKKAKTALDEAKERQHSDIVSCLEKYTSSSTDATAAPAAEPVSPQENEVVPFQESSSTEGPVFGKPKQESAILEGTLSWMNLAHIASFVELERDPAAFGRLLCISTNDIELICSNAHSRKDIYFRLLLKWYEMNLNCDYNTQVKQLQAVFVQMGRYAVAWALERIDGGGLEALTAIRYDGPDIYNMQYKQRGNCIIINNKQFSEKTQLAERFGSETDCKNLKEVFDYLGFSTVIYKNKTRKKLLDIVDKASKVNYSEMDCFVFAISSHGNENQAIYCRKGKTVMPNEIIEPFKGNNCMGLTGKPKLFLFTACRGNKYDFGAKATTPQNVIDAKADQVVTSVEADILRVFSCVPDYVSIRNCVRGSWFIDSLASVMRKYGDTRDMLWMLTQTNNQLIQRKTKLAKPHPQDPVKQVAEVVSTLTKQLYFIPKYETLYKYKDFQINHHKSSQYDNAAALPGTAQPAPPGAHLQNTEEPSAIEGGTPRKASTQSFASIDSHDSESNFQEVSGKSGEKSDSENAEIGEDVENQFADIVVLGATLESSSQRVRMDGSAGNLGAEALRTDQPLATMRNAVPTEPSRVDLVRQSNEVEFVEQASRVEFVEHASGVDLVEQASGVDLVEQASGVDLVEQASGAEVLNLGSGVASVEQVSVEESV